jgi:predicted transposase/invertase (TIGR01784 family)
LIYLEKTELTNNWRGVIEPEESAATKARELINLARGAIADAITQRELIQLIETIIVYKFPQKSREEIEQMLGLSDLKQTRVYQEALEERKLEGKLEGKLETVPFMLRLGATVEQIAQALGLDVEQVRQVRNSLLSEEVGEESDTTN